MERKERRIKKRRKKGIRKEYLYISEGSVQVISQG